jgi:hypothetical protein
MVETAVTILTNEHARDAEQVAAKLEEEFSAGAPWYD